jgi:hypothetical protein
MSCRFQAIFFSKFRNVEMPKISDADRVHKRAQAHDALALYPNIDKGSLETLLRWFHREASAMDVALLSGDPTLAGPYEQFRKDYMDRLTLADWIRFLLLFVGGGLLFAPFVWMAH